MTNAKHDMLLWLKMEPMYYQQIKYVIKTVVVLIIIYESVYCRPALPWECPTRCDCDEVTLQINCSLSGYTRMPKVENNTRILFLEGNHINVVENGVFASLNNLRMLSLANNEIDEIQENAFKFQRKVAHLDLSGNFLGEVPVALNNLRVLKELVLSGNELRTLSKEPWLNITRLTTLLLDANHIPNIPLVMISKLRRLTTLSVRKNSITSIPRGQFINSTDLEYLDLSFNQIGTNTDDFSKDYGTDSYVSPYLPTTATDREYHEDNIAHGLSVESFLGLVNLVELNLASNLIRQLQNGIFSDLHSLEVLHLDGNGLENIEEMVFREQYKLQTLILSNNALTELQQGMFEDLRLLQVLKVDNNNLIDISTLTNIHMFHLKNFYLHDNRITTIGPHGFQQFKSLEEIYLQRNRLRHLPLVGNLSFLQVLDISENSIRELTPVNAFDGTDLQFINLNYNRLESVHFDTFLSLKNLDVLLVEGNPFVCDCRLLWIIENHYDYNWLQSDDYMTYGARNQIQCQSPRLVEGKYLMDAYMIQRGLKCTEYIQHQTVVMLVIIWGGIVAFILISFWVYIYFDFKRKFKVRIPRKRYLLLHNSEKVNSLIGNHVNAARLRSYDTESESYIYDEETTV